MQIGAEEGINNLTCDYSVEQKNPTLKRRRFEKTPFPFLITWESIKHISINVIQMDYLWNL
jgi:hypothetical protein